MNVRSAILVATCATLGTLVSAPASGAVTPPKPGIYDATPREASKPAGQRFAFNVLARNVDRHATRIQPLAFYLSTSKSVKGARKLGTGSIPSLPGNTARAAFPFSVLIPLATPPGPYRLLICRPRTGELPSCPKTIALTVRKATPPVLRVSAVEPPISFGQQVITTTSAARTITVQNVGGSPTSTISTGLLGTGAGAFVKFADGCAGRQLASLAYCTVKVAFAPSAADIGSKTAQLRASATRGGTTSAHMIGTGVEPPVKLEVTPDHYFGSFPFGATSPSYEFTVTNTGTARSGPLKVISSGLDSGFFEVEPASADTCDGVTLAPAATCTVQARFHPVPSLAHGHVSAQGYLRAYDTSWDVPGIGLLVYADGVMTGDMETLTGSRSLGYSVVTVGDTSLAQTITITNVSGVQVTGGVVAFDGPDSDQFSIQATT